MTTNPNTNGFNARTARRGIALLLVVVTLATATVLTTSYLVSRENAPEIGEAAQARVTADWSARTAAGLVEAAMETTAEWRSAANAGMLLQDMDLLGATVNVCVTNLEGGPVADDDRHVLMTVTAVVDGIETVVQRVVSENDGGDYTEALDPELNEFGVFASKSVEVGDDSRVMLWPTSPVVRAGGGGKIGLGFTDASALNVGTKTLSTNANVYKAPGSTAGLDSMLSAYELKHGELPVRVWATTAEIPGDLVGVSAAQKVPSEVKQTTDTTLTGGGYAYPVTISGGANVVLDEAQGPYFFAGSSGSNGFAVEGATLTVRGHVRVCVLDRTRFSDMRVKFDTDSSLTVYHADNVEIENAVIGADPDLLDVADRWYRNLDTWTDPRRVRFVQVNTKATDPSVTVLIKSRSLVVGSVHAPASQVVIDDQSGLAGRVSAGVLTVTDESAVLLDPLFDNGLGLTSKRSSPLYKADGELVDGLKTAMELTTVEEGVDAAKARLLAALPAMEVKDDSAINGATRRHADTVHRLREWPVRVRMQESDDRLALFGAPEDETLADALGGVVSATFDLLTGTEETKKETSESDVLKLTLGL